MIATTLELVQKYQSLQLKEVMGYEKSMHYAITHHSTTLEGSTLTETETQLLLDQDLTPKGKPLSHSLMAKDHYAAFLFVLEEARQKRAVEVTFIKAINAQVLRNTGAVYNTLLGVIDSSKGEFRKSNVRAGNRYFLNYAKVPTYTQNFAEKIAKAATTTDAAQQLLLSFDAHFELVSIHPFYDGNGRTSRLLMNFLQAYFNLPLAIVFTEDKVDYFDALEQTRKQEDRSVFHRFMLSQYEKHLKVEIERFEEMMRI